MKKLIIVAFAGMFISGLASAGSFYGTGSNSRDVYVHGYTRSDGTYVGGYHRTAPNDTQRDNYSTKGNYNPYTGEYGDKYSDD